MLSHGGQDRTQLDQGEDRVPEYSLALPSSQPITAVLVSWEFLNDLDKRLFQIIRDLIRAVQELEGQSNQEVESLQESQNPNEGSSLKLPSGFQKRYHKLYEHLKSVANCLNNLEKLRKQGDPGDRVKSYLSEFKKSVRELLRYCQNNVAEIGKLFGELGDTQFFNNTDPEEILRPLYHDGNKLCQWLAAYLINPFCQNNEDPWLETLLELRLVMFKELNFGQGENKVIITGKIMSFGNTDSSNDLERIIRIVVGDEYDRAALAPLLLMPRSKNRKISIL